MLSRPSIRSEPFPQFRPSTLSASPDRHRQGALLADDDDQPLPARHTRIEEVPGQHHVVLGRHRDDDGGVFRALGFVDRRGIGQHNGVEFAEWVGHDASVELGGQRAFLVIDADDHAEIAVENLAVVVIDRLYDTIADSKGMAEVFDRIR